jgi:hypothetical protein
MKSNKLLMVSMLFVLMVLGGCHYGSHDDHRDYGYSSRSGSYRDGFRDGRAYERRTEDSRDSRYSSDWWRRRW